MRSIAFFLIFFFFYSTALSGQSDNNIKGLKFSKAFFVSIKSEQKKAFVGLDTTIVVERGRVWNVTSIKAFKINKASIPFENEITLYLNDQIVYYYKSKFECPLWLPEGTYQVKLTSEVKDEWYTFVSYLSGIEYLIEN